MDTKDLILPKEQKEIRNKRIREFYKMDYTMEQICKIVGCSKTTVFYAIKGRAKKKMIIKK